MSQDVKRVGKYMEVKIGEGYYLHIQFDDAGVVFAKQFIDRVMKTKKREDKCRET